MFLGMIGISHKTAPVKVRERLAFDGDALYDLLSRLSGINGVRECCVLSTCNRTEFYLVPDRDNDWSQPDLVKVLDAEPKLGLNDLEPYLYVKVDGAAVNHLFEVTAGMDSMVVGETQIACQVKDAFTAAVDQNTNGTILNRLFHQAMETGKKVRSQTQIGEGSLSVSALACDLTKKIFSRLEDKTALLIGAGETAELTARHLLDRGIGRIVVANRTLEKAEQLTARLGGRAVSLDKLEETLTEVDVVVTSTSTTEPLLTLKLVQKAVLGRKRRPLFLIDLGVPRDVDARVDEIPEVFRYDMDDLQRMVSENRRLRAEEIDQARELVQKDAQRFLDWTRERHATPTIVQLQQLFEHTRRRELERLEGKLSPTEMEAVNTATQAMMKKILSHPIMHLKDAAKKDESSRLIQTIRDILGLHEEK